MTTVSSKYRGSKEFLIVYSKLIKAAQYRGIIYYTQVAKVLGIKELGHHMSREVGQILGEISEDEHRAGRPMPSAVAVAARGYPSKGFFNLARDLGKLSSKTSKEEHNFWKTEKDRVYSMWKDE